MDARRASDRRRERHPHLRSDPSGPPIDLQPLRLLRRVPSAFGDLDHTDHQSGRRAWHPLEHRRARHAPAAERPDSHARHRVHEQLPAEPEQHLPRPGDRRPPGKSFVEARRRLRSG